MNSARFQVQPFTAVTGERMYAVVDTLTGKRETWYPNQRDAQRLADEYNETLARAIAEDAKRHGC